MNTPAKRPLGRVLGIAVLAVLVALVAAVSAFAVGGSTGSAGNPASSPALTQPVQDSQVGPGLLPCCGCAKCCRTRSISTAIGSPGTPAPGHCVCFDA